MARGIVTPMEVPRDQALARAEICTDAPGRDGGLMRLGICLNTLYDQKRGQLINEWDGAGRMGPAVCSYVCPVLGNGGLVEPLSPSLFFAAGVALVSMQVGGLLGTATWGPVVGAGWNAPAANTLVANDSVGARPFDIQAVSLTITRGTVYGVSLGYTRARATLPTTTSIAPGWATYYNNVTPIDTLWLGGERPLSVARLDDMRYMARNFYKNRLGPILSKALNTRWMNPGEYLEWHADVPTGQWTDAISWPETAQHLDDDGWWYAVFYVHVDTMMGVTLTLDCEASDWHPTGVWAPGSSEKTFTLRIKASREAGDLPQIVRFVLTDDASPMGYTITYIHGYWSADATITMPR